MDAPAAPDPMAAIQRFVEAFNADDVEGMQAACADGSPIVDDFPPHFWSGPGATSRWYREMAAMAGSYGMAGWSVTPGEPTAVGISGSAAYVVVPVDVRWQQDGSPVARAGFLSAALGAGSDGWRIAAFTWTWT